MTELAQPKIRILRDQIPTPSGRILSTATPRQRVIADAFRDGHMTHAQAGLATENSIFSSRKVVTELGRDIDPNIVWSKTRLLYYLVNTGELLPFFDDLPESHILRALCDKLNPKRKETLLLHALGLPRITVAQFMVEAEATTRCRMNNIGRTLNPEPTGYSMASQLVANVLHAGTFNVDPYQLQLYRGEPGKSEPIPFFMLSLNEQVDAYLQEGGIRELCLSGIGERAPRTPEQILAPQLMYIEP